MESASLVPGRIQNMGATPGSWTALRSNRTRWPHLRLFLLLLPLADCAISPDLINLADLSVDLMPLFVTGRSASPPGSPVAMLFGIVTCGFRAARLVVRSCRLRSIALPTVVVADDGHLIGPVRVVCAGTANHDLGPRHSRPCRAHKDLFSKVRRLRRNRKECQFDLEMAGDAVL